MRKIVLLIAGLVLAVSGYSQVSADLGLWGGMSGTMGDIEDQRTLLPSTFPVLGGFFRYNFHQRTSARFMVLAGRVAGEGPIQGYPWEFKKSFMDISFQAEINYLKYMIGNKKAWFTSYLTAGAGVMLYSPDQENIRNIWYFNPLHPVAGTQGGISDQPVTTLTFPFGMGFKVSAGKNLGIGIEYQMRKLFNDNLDDLDDPLATIKNGETVKYTDFIHNNDWAGFLGLHVTYKIYMGGKPCPAYDSKN